MSDPSEPHGTPSSRPTRQGDGDGSWTPPPPSSSPPPPAPTSPADTTGPISGGRDHTGSTTAPMARGATVTLTPGLVLGLVAVVAVVLGLFISESDGGVSGNLWDRTSAPLWSIVAIVAAVAALGPALRGALNVPAKPVWTAAAVGAAYLVFWWVLFVLPVINLNVAFLVTLGVAAGVAAVWTSPDNPYRSGYDGS